MLIRFTPGPRQAARIAAFGRSMAATCTQAGLATCVRTDQRPNGVTGYARIDCGSCSLGSSLFSKVFRFVRTEYWW